MSKKQQKPVKPQKKSGSPSKPKQVPRTLKTLSEEIGKLKGQRSMLIRAIGAMMEERGVTKVRIADTALNVARDVGFGIVTQPERALEIHMLKTAPAADEATSLEEATSDLGPEVVEAPAEATTVEDASDECKAPEPCDCDDCFLDG